MSERNIFFGIVINNDDNLKIGRCQVRIIGLYDGISDNDLPWLQIITPITFSTMIKPPNIGEQVACISLDEHNQTILILGIVPGISDYTNYPDTPREARNDSSDISNSIVYKKSKNLIDKIGSSSWSEPDAKKTYSAIYPKNRVLETESGHFLEFDDTEGSERIHIYHKTGSYVEIIPDGSIVIRSINNSYTLTDINAKHYIGGSETKNIEESKLEEIGRNSNISIKGSETKNVEGSITLVIGSSLNITSPTMNVNASSGINFTTPKLQVNGEIVASQDIIGEGISLSSHVHGGVMNGGSSTTPPI